MIDRMSKEIGIWTNVNKSREIHKGLLHEQALVVDSTDCSEQIRLLNYAIWCDSLLIANKIEDLQLETKKTEKIQDKLNEVTDKYNTCAIDKEKVQSNSNKKNWLIGALGVVILILAL